MSTNVKTPDVIKKGLECCGGPCSCAECPHSFDFPFEDGIKGCIGGLEEDAIAYIQQLERERDFLIKYLTDSTFASCDICKHGAEGASVMDCEQIRKVGIPCFEWRGLPEDDNGR